MKRSLTLATLVAFSAVALGAHTAAAQSGRAGLAAQRERDELPCAVAPSVIDSARVDAVTVLYSDRPLLTELRHEQGIPASATELTVTPVRDGSLCKRLASQFDHALAPTSRLAVLRVGTIFYARDPDQRVTTGIFTDSTFHVLLRLGAAIEK
jgi:hypothetical protein